MKKLFLILLVLVVLVVGAALTLPFILPTETYKAQLAERVEAATGRALAIDGPLEFALLPRVSLRANDVRFANAPGAAEPDMARLAQLQVDLEIWPLLQGTVEVARFVLVEPTIHLAVDADGRPNWQFGEPPAPGAGGGEGPAPEGEGTALPISDVKLGDIRLENGTVTYSDATTGVSETLQSIDLTIRMPDLRSRLLAEGDLDYQGETVELNLALDSPYELLQGGGSPVDLAIAAAPVRLGFAGLLSADGAPGASGEVDLAVGSIRDLASWLGQPLQFEGEGLRTFGVTGKLHGSAAQIALTDATIALDAIEGQGDFLVQLAGAVPKLSGQLALGAVDLNPYLPPERAADAGGTAADTGTETTGASRAAEEATTGAGAEASGQVTEAATPGEAGPSAWSDEPIQLPPLGVADADFRLTADSLVVRDLEIGRSDLAVRLADGALEAELNEFALYGGQGTGRLQVTLVDGVPQIDEAFDLEGLDARPFLRDAARFEHLRGTASIEVSLTSRGDTERQLVENLDGAGRVVFRDGAIVGINVAAMVRNVASAFLDPAAGEERETDFAELSGSFTIEDGRLTNDDLWLQSPVLRVAGRGTVDLPGRTLDYRIEPKAAPTLEGQGGEKEVAGVLVPVVVRGPWDAPVFAPDLAAVARQALENPDAVLEQAEQLGIETKGLKKAMKKLKKKDEAGDAAKTVLEALTAGDDDGDGKSGQAARKLLEGLFGN
jgi:AsmA protein